MNVGELLVRLGLDMADFRRGMNHVRDEVSVTNKALNGLKTVIAGVVAGVGIASGWKWLVSGNAQMEQYRQTLNIVMKDTQKAGELLEWATKFAAKTPFEIPEIIESTVRLQAYGIEARNVLGDLGDMAAAMGKPLTQAMEAVADAQTGELERLKEFGITKDMLASKAQEMYNQEIVNSKGQITNMQMMNNALTAIIRDRYHGAMEAQSTTLNGMISNLKDWLGTAGRILGQNIFEKTKAQLKELLTTFNNLSDSGQLEVWGKRLGDVFGSAIDITSKLFNFINDHSTAIKAAILGVASSFIILKFAMITTAIVEGLTFAFVAAREALVMYRAGISLATIAQWAFNSALLANPMYWVVIAIGALVAAAYALYKAWVNNWGGIQDKTKAVASVIVSFFNRMIISIATGFNQLKRKVFSLLSGIMSAVAPVVGLIGKIAPGFEAGFDKAQSAVNSKIDDIDLKLQELGVSAQVAGEKLSNAMSSVKTSFMPKAAEASTAKPPDVDTGDLPKLEAEANAAAEAVSGLGNSMDGLGGSAGSAGGKASKAAEDTRAAWEKTADKLGVGLQILQAEYDIAAAKMGENATETDKLSLKSAHLSKQLELQKQIVASVAQGYDEAKASKEATAEETQKLELRLTQERKSQAELEKEIRSTNSALDEQGKKMKDLTKNVQETAGKYRQDLTKALEDYQKKVEDVNKKLIEDEQKATQEYQKAVDSRAKSLMDWVGLFDSIPEPKEVSGLDLLGNLDDQVSAFRDWQANLQTLAARGIDQGLISELEQMGPKASSEIAALNSLTDDELQQYVLLWQEKSSLATQQATSELTGLKNETESKISELRSNAAAQLTEYANDWENKNREIRENTVKELEKLVEEAQKLGAAFAAALTGAISTALPDLSGTLNISDTDQVGEAADQRQVVINEAKAQASQHVAIVQSEVSSLLQSWSDAGNQLSSKQNEIKAQSIATWQEVQQRLSALWQKTNADLVKGWTDNRNFIYDILGQVDTRFQVTVNYATNWGSNLIGNLISGIASRRTDLTNTLESVAQEISNYLGFSSPTKKGPGSNADQWMPNLVGMMTGDLQGGVPLIRGAVSQLAAQMAKLSGIESVVTSRIEDLKTPELPKLPDAPPAEYQAKANVERTDSVTQEVETNTAAIEATTPTIDVPTIMPDVELQTAEVEVLTGSLQEDIATIFKSVAALFTRAVKDISFSSNNSGGQASGLTKLKEDIEYQASRFSATPNELLAKLRAPAVNVDAPVAALTGSAGNVFNIDITGSNAEEIWEQLERELQRHGVRW